MNSVILGLTVLASVGSAGATAQSKIEKTTKVNSANQLVEVKKAAKGDTTPKEFEVYRDIEIPKTAHKIERAYYFERLGSRHGENKTGKDRIIPIQIVFGYYDSQFGDAFVNDGYEVVSKEYIDPNNFYGIAAKAFQQSPGTDDYLNGINYYYNYLYYKAKNELNINMSDFGIKSQKKLIRKLFSEIPTMASYVDASSEGNLNDNNGNKTYQVVTNAIDDDMPVIVNFGNHSVVAYAYNSDWLWFHDANGGLGATPISTIQSYNFSTALKKVNRISAYALMTFTGDRWNVHSNNYQDLNSGICVCGNGSKTIETWVSNTNQAPTYFTEEPTPVYRDYGTCYMDIFYKNTYKTADDNAVLMRHRRTGGDEAFVEYWAHKPVHQYSFTFDFYNEYSYVRRSGVKLELWNLHRDPESGWYWWEECRDLAVDRSVLWPEDRKRPVQVVTKDLVSGFKLVLKDPDAGEPLESYIRVEDVRLWTDVGATQY